MRRTYVAWNGESYPWPPPEGWYHATDGRWWAPLADPSTIDEPAEEATPVLDLEAADRPTVLTGRPRLVDGPLDPTGRVTATSVSSTTSASGTAPTITTPHDLEIVPTQQPDSHARQRTRPLPTVTARRRAWRNRLTSRRFRTTALAGLLVGAVLAGTAFGLALTRATLTIDEPHEPPAAGSSAPTTAAAGDGDLGEDGDRGERAQRFRDLAAAAGLDTDRLGDSDIVEFGRNLCDAAAVTDPAGFETVRTELAGESLPTGGHTPEDLATTVDAALLAFCPDQAARLGTDET